MPDQPTSADVATARATTAQESAAADAPLVEAAGRGETAAFNRLVIRHQDAVFTLCFRLTGNPDDAADAAQEAFLSAFRNLSSFRGGVFRSWLLRIAANACYDLHRQRRRRPADSLDQPAGGDDGAPLDVPEAGDGPEEAALKGEMAQMLQSALLALPEEQRMAIVLCDLYDFDYQAIADMTGVELGTVKSRINRGRRRLRDVLLARRELLPASYRLMEEPPTTSPGPSRHDRRT
jgi:RNA polymerase sigma-70 factor (ECF subfamily)